jgi:hypothetical protein
MKREEIKAIFPDITDEQLDKVMTLHGAEIEKTKAKVTALETELKEKKEAFDSLNTEFETLKTSNASGEEWKSKYEALQAENEAKAKQAEADRILKEKQDAIESRFKAVLGDKEFNHPAIQADVLKRFGEALDVEENKSKSDADIFHDLTKDDATAFKGVTVTHLAGSKAQSVGTKQYTSKAEIMAIKDSTERLGAIQANPNLFRKE